MKTPGFSGTDARGNRYQYDGKHVTQIQIAQSREFGADWLPLNIDFKFNLENDPGLKEHLYGAVFGHLTPRLKEVAVTIDYDCRVVTLTGRLYPLGDVNSKDFVDLFDFDPHPAGTPGQRSNNAEGAVVFVNRNALPGSTDFRILAKPEHYPTIQKSYPFELFE